jgi:hypothetical protein
LLDNPVVTYLDNKPLWPSIGDNDSQEILVTNKAEGSFDTNCSKILSLATDD